jgi:glycosyltransferase involved in cell wall biosynthesis
LGSDIWTLGKVPLVRNVLKSILQSADRRYADGIQLASDVEAICGRPCDFLPSTRLLPRISRAEKAQQAPYKLAFLGRWHRNKGVDLLLDAINRLTDSDWSRITELRIFGGGPLHDQVHSAVHVLRGRNRSVTIGGYLDKDAAAELIGWADYLLLPSRIESIPVIFSDAMQLHTPIIATPVGDLPRLFDKHRVGVLAAKADAQEFARAVQQGLHENVAHFSEAIDLASKDFDLTTIVREFVSAMEHPST